MEIWKTVPEEIRLKCKNLEYAILFTEEKFKKIEVEIKPILDDYDKKIAIVFAGSMGRKDANKTSDIDVFVLFENEVKEKEQNIANKILQSLETIVTIKDISLRLASTGAFSNACSFKDLLTNIGGKIETNDTLTRRMLLLIEGDGISSEGQFFKEAQKKILMKYLADLQPRSDKRPIFLLNDLIRYYRTICVDYEYKKNEIRKPWAVRLLKLRHSRKILYFSALLPLLESMSKNPKERIPWLEKQFTNYSPLERIILLLSEYGAPSHWRLLIYYNNFIKFLSSKKRRQGLDNITFGKRDKNQEYIKMRDNARKLREIFHHFILSVPHWQEPLQKYVLS